MNEKILERAQELRDFMRQCQEAMDAWERQENPLMPDRLRNGAFPIGRGNDTALPVPSAESWQVYKRAAIRELEKAHDRAKRDFDKL